MKSFVLFRNKRTKNEKKTDLNQNNIQLVQIDFLLFQSDLIGRVLYDQTDNILLYSFTLISWQRFPLGFYRLLQDLQRIIFGLLVL